MSTAAHWGLFVYIGIRRSCPGSEYHNHCLYKTNIMHGGSVDMGQLNWSKILLFWKRWICQEHNCSLGAAFLYMNKKKLSRVGSDNYSFYKLNIVHDGSTCIVHLNWSTIWHYALRRQHSGIKCLLKVHELRWRDGYDNGYTVQRWKTIIIISTNPISWFIGSLA